MESPALTQLQHEMRSCRRCLEAGYPIREGAIFSGSASARIMVVGQAPGIREGGTGLPFSGPAGKRLFSWLAHAGFEESEFRVTQYITAITKCFPGKGNSRGDRVPTAVERRLCAPFLARESERNSVFSLAQSTRRMAGSSSLSPTPLAPTCG
jgi:uracil-DNA glycosylase